MSDGFSMDFEKLGDLIEKLNLLDENVNAGDEVWIDVNADDFAKKLHTIPYEILTSCPGERDITKECANGYKFEPKK